MQDIQRLRHEIISVVNVLPVDGLKLLAEFVAFLRAKFNPNQPKNSLEDAALAPKTSGSPFLMSIAGIGQSAETDLSTQDEEILAQEIDPIRGWGLKMDNLP